MFNGKLKAEIKRQSELIDKYREQIDAMERLEKENAELKLKLRIMEMYCNDDDAILELLEAKKAKVNVSQSTGLAMHNNQLSAFQNAALTGRPQGCPGVLAGLGSLAGMPGASFR